LAGLDSDGLSREHLEYLRTLKLLDEQAGLKNLCNMLRMSPGTVEGLERLLATRGYIRYTPNGRLLTPAGRAKVRSAQMSA
jgi:Mn-dependent DtxR family transcriptional regulator